MASAPAKDIHDTFLSDIRELVEANNQKIPDALYETMLIRIGDQELFTKRFTFTIINFTCVQEDPGNEEVRFFKEHRTENEKDMEVKPPQNFVKTYHAHFDLRPSRKTTRIHFPIMNILVEFDFMIRVMGEKLLSTEVASSLEPEDLIENFKPSIDYTRGNIQLIMFKKGIIRSFIESMLEEGDCMFSPDWRPTYRRDEEEDESHLMFQYRKPTHLQFFGYSMRKNGASPNTPKSTMVSINYHPQMILNLREERND